MTMTKRGWFSDLLQFLWMRRAFWLIPLLVIGILLAVLFLGGGSADPFTYR